MATSKPSSSSSLRSDRLVKKRRCGESGSGVRMSGPCNGVVSASSPPGRSTRRISESKSWMSRTCSSTSMRHDAVEGPVVERERRVGRELHGPVVRTEPPACAPERNDRDIRRGPRGGVDVRRQPAVAAAQVEHPIGVPERFDELALASRRPVVVVADQLPQLVVVAASAQRAISMQRMAEGREPPPRAVLVERMNGSLQRPPGSRRQP